MTSTGRGRTTRAGVLGAVAALVLVGCSGGGEGVDVPGGEDPAGAEDGADPTGGTDGEASEPGVLVAGISSQPDQLDPHVTTAYPSFQVLENVYDTLVQPDAEGEFQPALATEWETSEDNLTWTFTLREGVTFHDGSTFEAADVVYSFQRIIDEELSNAYRFAGVESVEAPDEGTVVISLSQPTPQLLDNIGGFKGTAIVSEGAAEEFDLVTEANGTGPFRLESSAASAVELTAFEDYWGEEGPFVDGVEFRTISEPTTALTALQTGEIHWTDNLPPQQVEALTDGDDLELAQTPSVDYWYLALNEAVEPWDSVDARRGVGFAMDREAIAQAARFGGATVNQTAIPEQSFWFHDYAPYELDTAQAADLLASGGVQDGQPLELMVTDEFPETVTAAQVLEANLGEVGIDVSVQSEPFATWLDRQGQGDFDAFILGWLGNLDPFGFYDGQHRCEGGNNFHGYCNPDVDELLDSAATEIDRDARKALYDQAAELIVDDASYLYMYNPDVVHAWVPGLTGYETRADRAINFETVRLPE